MNRFDAYFKQLVNQADVDEWLDEAENALWNLAIDIGLEGVVSGAVATETGTPSMSILLSNPCRAYDQLGRRIYYAPQQTIDCSVDEDSNPTVPASGNERWVTVAIEHTRLLSDPQTDGNGATVFYQRDESFNVRVIAGAEVTAPAVVGDKPSAPSDALILVEILMDDSTTSITNAMLQTADAVARRQDFVWTTADKIGVTAGSWSNIDSTVLEVQDALDSVDTELISRNASGEVDATLLPNDSVATGSATKRWTTVFGKVVNVSTGLVAASNGLPAGDATNRLEVYTNTATVYTAIVAASSGLPIGDATNRFDAHLEDAIIYGTLVPDADDQDLGSATKRWALRSTAVTSYNSTVSGAVVMSAAKTISRRIGIGRPNQDAADWVWQRTLTLWSRTVTNTYKENATGPGAYASWDITAYLPDGAAIKDLYMTYGIEVTSGAVTADMECYMMKRADTGVETEVGSITSLNTTGAWQDDATVFTGKTEVVAKATYTYHIVVRSAGTAGDIDTRIVGWLISYEASDIGLAALGSN